ncbi:hypothetical protein [Amycolatopsis rubida]|uniref:Uncharacterized protein n=1 Tax=Amycolatopsis rubida TaxID=112413 RepID=A0A1I5KSZ2_9PSEU|nr:hypothetical protein [Amycolatopsis rubida]SFO88062.1 hypothetical protein SAMN05421854_103324 [Amycolatopsis rubida]
MIPDGIQPNHAGTGLDASAGSPALVELASLGADSERMMIMADVDAVTSLARDQFGPGVAAMDETAALDEDEVDLALMRTRRRRGEPVPEAALEAAARYVDRHYPKGRIPEQLIQDFPSQVRCIHCQELNQSNETECRDCGATIRLHWTAGRDNETLGGA